MVIADYHFLFSISNITFVPDVGACEWVIARDHHNPDFSLFELFDRRLRFGFQFVLEDLKAREKQVGLRLFPRNLLYVPLCLLVRDRQYSEPVRSVLLQFGFVVRGDAAFLHDPLHDLRRPFGVDVVFYFVADRYFADNAHSLHVGVEVESAVDFAGLLALGLEGKDDFGVGVGLVEGELSKLEQLHLHRIPDEFAGVFEADN